MADWPVNFSLDTCGGRAINMKFVRKYIILKQHIPGFDNQLGLEIPETISITVTQVRQKQRRASLRVKFSAICFGYLVPYKAPKWV